MFYDPNRKIINFCANTNKRIIKKNLNYFKDYLRIIKLITTNFYFVPFLKIFNNIKHTILQERSVNILQIHQYN